MAHHILVIDDDPDIRETIVEILEEAGHAAASAANGNEALELLRAAGSDVPCLILLDLMMPIMDGRTFREEQLKDPALSPIPVIVLSAFRDTADAAQQMAVAGHLTKPVSLEQLISVVESFC